MAAFQTKNFLSIVASMINRMRSTSLQVTDFAVGGVARTMVEASAQEIDELYQQMIAGLVAAIPVATYRTFNFELLPAAYAVGYVAVAVEPATSTTLIAAGTTFTSPLNSVVYTSTADVTIGIGLFGATVPVIAGTVGAAGNLAAGATFTMLPAPPGFLSASNTVAWSTGQEIETEPQRKIRFGAFVQNLARGTVPALIYAAENLSFLTDANGFRTEQVAAASVFEPYLSDNTQPPGFIYAYVFNGTGSTSAGLVNQALAVINGYTGPVGGKVAGYKAAGVVVTVAAAIEQQVSPIAALTVAANYDKPALVGLVEQAWSAYQLALPIGASCVLAKLTELAMEVTGVTNIVFAAGQTDTAAAVSVKLMPGLPVLT